MATALSAKTFAGSSAQLSRKASRPCRAARTSAVVRASQRDVQEQDVTRRAALGMLAGIAAVATTAAPSYAAYGDSANVFGRVTNKSGFVPYAGEGYSLLIPSKWNPSKEQDFPGVDLRYEDNGDAVNNLLVITQTDGKKSIEDYGSPDKFLESVSYLFGRQTFTGSTRSEGGFAENRVSAASLLDASTATDKKGRTYYKYELLSRTADGDEGGRHQLISAAVGSDGKLYILKIQVGDKRWFKGVNRDAKGSLESFTVA